MKIHRHSKATARPLCRAGIPSSLASHLCLFRFWQLNERLPLQAPRHAFDRLCLSPGIRHRLPQARCAQNHGIIEPVQAQLPWRSLLT
ncbi:MAG: hypothetical protein OXC07_12790 [Kistimonas sp.]|nr:hypothetical protein [Kistimonas sp.]